MIPDRPSVFTPFPRRFTDERARELADTIELHRRVTEKFRASTWSDPRAIPGVVEWVIEEIEAVVELPSSPHLREALDTAIRAIVSLETTIFTVPEIDWDSANLTLQEQVDLRRFLRAQEHFLDNEDRISAPFGQALRNAFGEIVSAISDVSTVHGGSSAPFTVPVIAVIDDPNGLVEHIAAAVTRDTLNELGLFTSLRDTLYRNMCRAAGIEPDDTSAAPLTTPSESRLPPAELVRTFLADTPFHDLLLTPVPFSLPQAARFEHTHIVAGTGHGKTQTLQHLILHDLLADPENAPSLVIIDSQGDMLSKLSRLDLFDPDHGALADRLIIIDPTDVEHPPALGLFDVNLARVGAYGARQREQIMNGVIELYEFIFGGLLGAELTQKQNVIFRYLARLMLVIPEANILTLRDVMQDASPFVPYFEKLDGMAREFFLHEFNDREFAATKKQILRRLWGVLENPTFERLFSNPRNRLDMFKALNTGKIVLVNTAKDFLKAERSSILGRFFIALTFQAALERAALPETARRPAFLYIDEAADYFDETIDSLLNQARKFRLGVVFAHQYLDQLPRPLLASIMTNTSIKLAGGVSSSDANLLARNMATTSETIAATRKRRHETEFVTYIRNVTDRAMTLTVPLGSLEKVPTMSAKSFARLMADNQRRTATMPDKPRPAKTHREPKPVSKPTTAPSDQPDDWRS